MKEAGSSAVKLLFYLLTIRIPRIGSPCAWTCKEEEIAQSYRGPRNQLRGGKNKPTAPLELMESIELAREDKTKEGMEGTIGEGFVSFPDERIQESNLCSMFWSKPVNVPAVVYEQTSTSMRLCGAGLDMGGPIISRSIEGLITPYRHT
ncbi:hypothetical protein VNO80_33802 [Phaseolus coccineus]|uniref:Uncharacterized protein n=1 Tax=Phaseolus coccineus TaxID=3886 RepID=A0AAN9L0F1_PHACN